MSSSCLFVDLPKFSDQNVEIFVLLNYKLHSLLIPFLILKSNNVETLRIIKFFIKQFFLKHAGTPNPLAETSKLCLNLLSLE